VLRKMNRISEAEQLEARAANILSQAQVQIPSTQ